MQGRRRWYGTAVISLDRAGQPLTLYRLPRLPTATRRGRVTGRSGFLPLVREPGHASADSGNKPVAFPRPPIGEQPRPPGDARHLPQVQPGLAAHPTDALIRQSGERGFGFLRFCRRAPRGLPQHRRREGVRPCSLRRQRWAGKHARAHLREPVRADALHAHGARRPPRGRLGRRGGSDPRLSRQGAVRVDAAAFPRVGLAALWPHASASLDAASGRLTLTSRQTHAEVALESAAGRRRFAHAGGASGPIAPVVVGRLRPLLAARARLLSPGDAATVANALAWAQPLPGQEGMLFVLRVAVCPRAPALPLDIFLLISLG
jgi:hypothetical protein